MAEGLSRISGADLSVSITGVAGPDADDFNNPVGLVYIGIYDGKQTKVHECRFTGSRERIRNRAAMLAYLILHQYLTEI